MYIRTKDEAIEAVAEILDLPERRVQIIQSSVKIMLCLDAEPRAFMADCQALLIEGGLEALRRKRREDLESMENVPIVVLDPEEDRIFEAVGSALDALRLTDVVRQAFPEIRHERWLVARGLLGDEARMQAAIARAIKSHGNGAEVAQAQEELEGILQARRPAWGDRAGTLRSACFDVLKGAQLADADRLHEEAELLFELFAADDERASALLAAIDGNPQEAVDQVNKVYTLLQAVRSVQMASS